MKYVSKILTTIKEKKEIKDNDKQSNQKDKNHSIIETQDE